MIKKTAYITATGFGLGYFPFASGTFASFIAVLLFWFIPFDTFIWLIIILVIFIAGIWSGSIVENDLGKDPGIVIIDEIAGQWLTLVFLPKTMTIFIAGFILFRLLDIFKPFPINKSQKLKGGFGIMVDDILAGIFALVFMQIMRWIGVLN